MTRRRGTSGKERRAPGTAAATTRSLVSRRAALEQGVLLGARLWRELETALAERLDRLRPTRRASTRDEGGSEDDAMHEDGREQALDVLGDDVAPCVEKRPRTRRSLEREAAAHGAADDDGLLLARRTYELDHPAVEDLVDVDVLGCGPQLVHLIQADDRLEIVERVGIALVGEDLELVLELRVAERGAQEEAVELCLGQREGSLVLDRVLRGEQEERVRQLPRDAVDRDLTLGHRLEQCRLRLRRRPVDLVDEDDVGEDRPGPELEVPRPLIEDRKARHVRRLEIGRALDPLRDRTVDAAGDRTREHGLGRPRHVLEQHVTVARERGQDELDLAALAVDDRRDVVDEPVGDRPRALEALGLRHRGSDRLHRRDGICGYVR